jgi:HK97 family phage prohead protease
MARAKAMGKEAEIPDTWQADGTLSAPADSSARSEDETPYIRSFRLVDINPVGDGRTVEAYAAVFDSPTHITDRDGEYEEVIDPSAFNDAIVGAQRSGHKIPVLFNHGLTLYGTPSEIDAAPIGVTEEIRADRRGLFTRARYHNNPRADSVLEAIREGSIASYSFQGEFKRSAPSLPRGGRYKGQTVRRTESTLREYGPTTFPAYKDAAIVGVRAEQAILAISNLHPTEVHRLVGMLQAGLPAGDTGLLPESTPELLPPEEVTTPHDQIRASYAQFLRRRGAI